MQQKSGQPILDFRFWILDYRNLTILDFGFWIAGSWIPNIVDLDCGLQAQSRLSLIQDSISSSSGNPKSKIVGFRQSKIQNLKSKIQNRQSFSATDFACMNSKR